MLLGAALALTTAGMNAAAAADRALPPKPESTVPQLPNEPVAVTSGMSLAEVVCAAVTATPSVSPKQAVAFCAADNTRQLRFLRDAGFQMPAGAKEYTPELVDYLHSQAVTSTDPAKSAVLKLRTSLSSLEETTAAFKHLSANQYGELLGTRTASEIALMSQQQRSETSWARQQLSTFLRSALYEHVGPGYGSVWSEDGVTVVALTSSPSKPIELLIEATGLRYRIESAELSRQERLDLVAEVVSFLRDAGINDVGVATNQKTQRIVVVGPNAALDRATKEMKRSRWADAFEVEVSAGIDEVDVTFRGGLVWSGSGCSTAFVMNGHSTWGETITTAGHCGNTNNTWLGQTLTYRDDQFGAQLDGQIHELPRPGNQVENEIYIQESPYSIEITSRRPETGNGVDDVICHNGNSNGVACGSIINDDYTPNTGGLYGNCNPACTGLFRTDYLRSGGDSGAAVYDGSVAVGIHSGGNSNGGIFSSIEQAETQFGITVWTK